MESLGHLTQEEQRRKEEMRSARDYDFRRAWRMSEDIFEILDISSRHTFSHISQTTGKSHRERTIEIATATPWIPKDEDTEMRAVKIQRQKLPTTLGRLVLLQEPSAPEVTGFALDIRPPGNPCVNMRLAVLEPGHQPSERIHFIWTDGVLSTQEERYSTWHRKDEQVIDDLTRIYGALKES